MQTKGSGFRFTFLISAALLAMSAGACSPGSLFGNNVDGDVQSLRGYRRVNTACSRLDLSPSRLDAPSARKLVECLDANGALGGFAKLVKKMGNDELSPFVESFNRSLLNNPRNLYELEHTFQDLNERGQLANALDGLGQLLSNDELIARSISIFRGSYATKDRIDPDLLRAVERLSRELTDERVADGLDLALLASDARSFASLWDRLTGRPARALSPSIAEGWTAYARSNSRIGRDLVDHVIDGTIFEFLDKTVPSDAAGIRAQVPRWASLLNTSLMDQGRIASELGSLFGALGEPVPCMQGARAMLHAPMDMLREMSEVPATQVRSFIERDKLMQIFVTGPVCSYPSAVAAHYGALMDLAATPAVEPLSEVVRNLYGVGRGEQRPLADFFVRALGDPQFKQLLPALSEIQARGAWEDLLLLATAPQIRDRSQLVSLLKALVEPLPSSSGKSTYDVLVQGFAKVQAADLTAWLESFQSTGSGLSSALRAIRAAYYVNDAHPLVNLLRDSMANATNDPQLLEALLRVSARPEFRESLHELSEMARAHDGRLKDLLQTTLDLFHRYAERGQTPIHLNDRGEPGLRFGIRHGWDSTDLSPWRLPAALADYGACRKVDLSVSWDQLGNPGFEGQLQAVSACVNSDGKYQEIADALRLLGQERTDGSGGETRSIHAVLVDAWSSFHFTRAEAKLFADWTLNAVQDGRVLRALKAVPIWVHHSVVRPLVDIADPIVSDIEARMGLRRLGVYGASALKRADFQKVLAYADDLYRAHPAHEAAVPRPLYDRERLQRWVGNKECGSAAADEAKRARVDEVVDEYENAVVNHAPLSGGKLRHSWSQDELKTELDPIFKKFADPAGNGPLIRALLHFASRFNNPTQYPAGYLEDWLRKRANDRRIISYMYPGETRPRVRLVNSLDRLAIVLLNADIYAPDPINMNFGMQFLANIAEAWGDVPFEQRPAEIQAKYPKTGHKKCPTLAAAIADIKDTAQTFYDLVGLPVLPKCQQVANPQDPPNVQHDETTDPASGAPPSDTPPTAEVAALQSNLFNIAETVDVLQENVDDGGMRVLRDLFFDLYYTGPAANRDSNAGLRNNLSVVIRLVKVGVLRQAGLRILETQAGDPKVQGFFQAFLDGASSGETEPALNSLFAGDPKQDLIWGILGEILELQNPNDIATAKSIGFELLSGLDSLGKARTGSRNELLDPVLRALQPILSRDGAFLARHTDLVGDLLTWGELADFLRAINSDRGPARPALLDLMIDALSDSRRGTDLLAILKALDSNPRAHRAWDELRANWKSLDQLPEYRTLGLTEIGRQGLDFLEARASDGTALPADQAALSRKILTTVATDLERNDMELVDQLLALAQRRPDEFYRLVESVSQLIENGEVPHLLDLMQKNLQAVGH